MGGSRAHTFVGTATAQNRRAAILRREKMRRKPVGRESDSIDNWEFMTGDKLLLLSAAWTQRWRVRNFLVFGAATGLIHLEEDGRERAEWMG